MPRGQSSGHCAFGTFACRTFHRDTKASKRANLFHHNDLCQIELFSFVIYLTIK
jgi:hypothetical protein